MSRSQHQRLIAIIEPVLESSGYELVDVRLVMEHGGWTLRVCADLPLENIADVAQVPEDRLDLHDCEQISRELSAVLDVEDPIPQAYALEVSSPGIERPLRTAKHFAHFAGARAKIHMAIGIQVAGAERNNFTGTIKSVEADRVSIDCDGTLFVLPIADIDSAKLVPDWDAVMRGKSGVGAAATDAPKPIKPGHRPSQKKQKKQTTQGVD